MKNFTSSGTQIDNVTIAGGAKSGDLVKVGNIIGVATQDCASGNAIPVMISGTFDLPKANTDAYSQGDLAYYNAGTIAPNITGHTLCGLVAAAALSADTTVSVRLCPGISLT